MLKTFVLLMEAEARLIPDTTQRVSAMGVACGLSPESGFQLQVALTEALNNIVGHALSPGDTLPIEIRCESGDEFFTVTTIDHGKQIHSRPSIGFPEPHQAGGRGWPIILNWVEQVEFVSEPGYNLLSLSKALG